MVKVTLKRAKTKYDLSFNPFNKVLVERIKTLYDTKWDGEKKSWKISALSIFKLIISYQGDKSIFFNFGSEEEKSKFQELAQKEFEKEEKEKKRKELHEQSLLDIIKYKSCMDDIAGRTDVSPFLCQGIVPFRHQKIGAIFLTKSKSGLLAMEQGTGKSLTAILASEMNSLQRVLIICPNSLKYNWGKEIEKFINKPFHIINAKNNIFSPEEAKYIIVNYEYFASKVFDIKKITDYNLKKCDGIIIDESHKLKNTSANTFKNIQKQLGHIPVKMLLSGTIIPNRGEEIFGQLKFIHQEHFKALKEFMYMWCGKIMGKWNKWQYPPKTPIEKIRQIDAEFYNKLQPYMYRVKKADVLDLPDKTYTNVYFELSPAEQKEYNLIKEGVVEDASGEVSELEKLAIINRLRQYTAMLKARHSIETLERLIEEGEKIVLFDVFKEPLNFLHDQFKGCSAVYHGDVKTDERQNIVDRFQDPDSGLNLILLSIGAGSVGLTLTQAAILIMNTQDWVPANNDQAVARIDRIGQQRNMTIYTNQVPESIDEDVYELNNSKLMHIKKMVDNENHVDESVQINLNSILQRYSK